MASPVATVWAQFRLDMSDFASKLNTASRSLRTFANAQRRVLKAQNQGFDKATDIIKSFNRSLSDTANITRGIIISQTFYSAVGAIRDATGALWQFNKELDYAHVTYSALFGDASLANDFMSVLQEHAIETIFNYQDLAGISKKLLAYGLEYKNLMFIMEGLTNLGTMSGDSAALDRIALALGQIYTKGKLSAEEMRQLANAYVPITDIIKEKFNLSEEDLGRVGDLNLPAEEVINAIVDYANENFGSVGDAAMYTITGLEAKIVDTLKVVGAEMLKPLTSAYKSFLVYIARGLEGIRESFAAGGIGGVFEYLVPDENTQKIIRTFIANIKNLFMSIMSLGAAAGQVFGNFAQVFVAVFNAVVPAITAIINTLAIMINALASTSTGAAVLRVALVAAAGAFMLMRVQAMGALVVTVVTKAVNALSKALAVLAAVIAKNPVLTLLAMLGIALVGISVSSNKASNALSGFFDTIAGTGGSSGKDTLQKTEEEINNANDALDKFNNRLEEGKDNAEDFEDGLNGAANAAKKTGGVLSFDEVFKLNDPKDSASDGAGAGSGVLDDMEDLIDGLGSLGDALIPEIPDFSDYFSDFGDSLFGGLSDSLKEKISAGGWGALIGGIIGGLIGLAFGNPVLGAKIGSVVGAFAGVLFNELEYAISNVGVGAVSGIVAAIGKALSKAGAAGLGTIVKNAFANGGIKGVAGALAGVIKSTGAKSLLKGGLIGAAVGLLVDGVAHLLWSTFEEKFSGANADTAKTGQTIGSLIGTVIGAIFGGPVGAIVGSTIGTFVGGFIGLFWEPIKKWVTDTAVAFAKWALTTWNSIGDWVTKTTVAIANWVSDTWDSFTTWTVDTLVAFIQWTSDTWNAFATWIAETILAFANWVSDTAHAITDWADRTWDAFTTWVSSTAKAIADWTVGTWNAFTTWVSNTAKALADWVVRTWNSLNNWVSNTLTAVTTWATNTARVFANWVSNTWNAVTTWSINTAKAFADWVSKVFKTIGDFCTNALKSINTWLSNMWKSMSTWFVDTGKDIANWWSGLFDITKWKSGWSSIKKWFSDLFSDISDWFSNLGNSVSNWWDGLWDGKKVKVNATSGGGNDGFSLAGHAYGGVFNREHIARFAEGNKKEAVIPLEEDRAMQPFVDAVSKGLTGSMAPMIAQINSNNSNSLPPMYVGTLIADERGLRELYRKFEIIKVQENDRRGLPSLG